MFAYSLLSVFLHTRIDGGINLQAIGIDTIGFAIFLIILVAPSVQRVCLPVDGVNVILDHVPRRIIRTLGLLRHDIATQEVTEINSYAILVVSHMEFQIQRLSGIFLKLLIRQISRLFHLAEHYVATLLRTVWIAHRVEV